MDALAPPDAALGAFNLALFSARAFRTELSGLASTTSGCNVCGMIKHLILATRAAAADENWYAALALALTIPDICARIETPGVGSAKRFTRWWNEHLTPKYTSHIRDRPHVFLHAEDAYALRCAFLHEGRADIDEQKAQKVLSSFRFVAPSPRTRVHCNQARDVLQLQVDIFCEDVCQAAEIWAGALPEEQDCPRLLEIEIIDPERSFWL